ncbi:MAG: hypothetical protein ABW217_03400 [Polyangiaceae bacterium]
MPTRTEDGRAFTGQYRIDAVTRPEGLSLRLSLDADLLLRLVTDTGGPSLELARAAPRDAPTLAWRRHRLGIATTLLGLAVVLGSLLWLSMPASERASDAPPASFSLPELPPPAQPSALTLPAPMPPPAPPVIRLEPVREAPASPAAPSRAAPSPAAPSSAALHAPPAVPRPRAAATPPVSDRPVAPPAAPKPAVERPATPPADVLDLFDDTK